MDVTPSAAPPAVRLLEESPGLRIAALAVLFGALTALSAQIKWYLPGNPVPITAQVFVVLLSGALLGARAGAASQCAYVGFGLLGAPVFAGGLGGPGVVAGPTGGYLLGFVLAAWVVGRITERSGRPALVAAAMAAGLAAIYTCGATWLAVWEHAVRALPWPAAAAQALAQGVAPFVPLDLLKAAVAGVAAARTRV